MKLLPPSLSLGALWLGAIACGGSAPPPQAPSAPKPALQAAPAPAPDLSAVPDPQTLVVSGRAAKLSRSLDRVHVWSNLPMPGSEQVTELLAGENMGPIVDLDRPIDFAVAVAGAGPALRGLVAVSAAVKDPDRVRAALGERYKLVPGENGATLIQGLGHASHEDRDEDDEADDEVSRVCELAPAFGEAPVRLVCGSNPKALAELGPWLTRTATRAPGDADGSTSGRSPSGRVADLHVDLRVAPLAPVIAMQKRMMGMLLGAVVGGRIGRGARALAMAFGSDVADFATDLDGLSLDVTTDDAGAQATTTLRFGTTTSAIARLATAHPERNRPAPAALWQMPGDADVAMFDRGIDEAEVARWRDLAVGGLDDLLGRSGMKETDRKAIEAPAGKLMTGAPFVYAGGMTPAAVQKATAEALLGWRVVEIDAPPATETAALKALAAAIARPSVAAAIRAKDKDATVPALRAAPVAKSAGLPSGTLHWVLELLAPTRLVAGKGAKKQPPPKPTTVHFFAAPDGARTWLAMGGDEATTASKLAASLGAATAGDKLSARPELAPWKDGSVGAAGFFTLRGLAEAVLAPQVLLRERDAGVAASDLDEAARLPNQGRSPVLFALTAQPPTPAAARAVATVTVPRGAIEDIVAGVLSRGGF